VCKQTSVRNTQFIPALVSVQAVFPTRAGWSTIGVMGARTSHYAHVGLYPAGLFFAMWLLSDELPRPSSAGASSLVIEGEVSSPRRDR
jgi:hypothetical protein